MVNVIPLAGLGSRFSSSDYTVPKPLIPVSGVPMILRVIDSLPESKKWIFIVRQEHIEQYNIDKIIKQRIPGAIIIAVNQTTLGQASTCLLAQAFINPDEPMLIAACDNICTYNTQKYEELQRDATVDCVVFTCTQLQKLRTSPKSYGWAQLADDQKTIENMSVKKPISTDPFYDHAVIATFYFKQSQDFIAATNLMIAQQYRVNNEFYVDALPIFLQQMKKKSVIFDVDQWVCWGTPQELSEYAYWEKFFKEQPLATSDEPQFAFWKRYFTP